MNHSELGSVRLAEGRSASAVLHGVLAEAVAAFPTVLGDADLPQTLARFRGRYPEFLPRFEALRRTAPEAGAIARHLLASLARQVVWEDVRGARPLAETLAEPAEPLSLESREFRGAPGWTPALVYRGERWAATELEAFATRLRSRGVVTREAADALTWVGAHALEDGRIRLPGRRIALLGAGAEMAPTRAWLEAGAEVLWLDVVPPPSDWLEGSELAGRLRWPPGGVDLLARPREVLATLRAFAAEGPIDLGLYAYAPGQARELRLTAIMNAIVEALAPESLASVTLLVSPTTPTARSEADVAAAAARRAARPAWEGMLARAGLLGRGGGAVASGSASVTRTVVSIQGTSYQAAQYLGKVLVAECWARPAPGDDRPPMRVSANTAAITRTRSLDHPVFAAAFGGAGAFGVETFTPRQSRVVNGLLALRDWLHPEAPVPGTARVHGGIHTLPYPLEPALRVAAAIGFARSPRLLRGLLRR
jgi:hypothetical protein